MARYRRMIRLRRVGAVAAFSVTSNLARWITRGGLVLGFAIMAVGPLLWMQRGMGWTFDDEIGAVGFFIMALFAVRSGLEEHREVGLETFLRHNLVPPSEYAAGLFLALLVTWATICAVGFLSVFALSGGNADMAAWSTARWGLRLLVVLGFIPLVETVATLRLPLILPALAYWGLLIALTFILPEEEALRLFIPVAPGELGQALRLALQGIASLLLTGTTFVLALVLGPPVRRQLRRLALRTR